MQLHSIFPTVIAIDEVENHRVFKDAWTQNAMNHMLKSGRTGEPEGMITIHKDPNFKPMMDYIHSRFLQYLSSFKVRTDMYDFNYVKAWMQVLREWETPKHSHADAMYTWIYYMNVPKTHLTTKLLCIENPMSSTSTWKDNSNEGYPSMFSYMPESEKTAGNAIVERFPTHEGTLFIMPAHLTHWTEPASGAGIGSYGKQMPTRDIASLKRNRVCIAGDILLSYKPEHSAGKAMGMQPVQNWLTY